MHISELELLHFRNYSHALVALSPGVNILYGENAQGKTNLLEAAYFLATGRSHRTSRDADLVQTGSPELKVRAILQRNQTEQHLEIRLHLVAGKRVTINGQPERRVAALVGRLAAVFFSPDDLQLVKGPPAGRRRFLDIELSQMYPAYLHHLQTYARVLAQRNALLRQIASSEADAALLELWDAQLADAGGFLVARRSQAMRNLAVLAATAHATLTQGSEDLHLQYEAGILAPGEVAAPETCTARMVEQLHRQRREEVRRGMSLVGPHRDDLLVQIGGLDARQYASQGQQRTAVLALKMAELQFMQSELQETPVLLLDDVLSELDPDRRRQLVNTVTAGVQTLITCTDLADLASSHWQQDARRCRIAAGAVYDHGSGGI